MEVKFTRIYLACPCAVYVRDVIHQRQQPNNMHDKIVNLQENHKMHFHNEIQYNRYGKNNVPKRQKHKMYANNSSQKAELLTKP